jgi:hypothetical protein
MVKLTNSLVESSLRNYGFLSRLQHQKETSSYTFELNDYMNKFTASVLFQQYILSFMVQVKIQNSDAS